MGIKVKRLVAICAILVMLPPSVAAETIVVPPFLSAIGQQGRKPWFRYENKVYLYGVSLPGEFLPGDPKERAKRLSDQEFGDDDYLYDSQTWIANDGRFVFNFQLKKPSYASLDEEALRLPLYIDLIREDYEKIGARNLRFSHNDTILHDTPVGRMLEVAFQFEAEISDTQTVVVHNVYYDYYDENNEYIFYLQGINSSYEEISDLLYQISQTIKITPIILTYPGRE